MKRILVWTALVLGVAIISHMAVLRMVPGAIMSKAMTAMHDRGVPLHGFALSPRITPKTQTIVRPSPDLAYSICRFDLSAGPILISGMAGPDYGSLTIFDASTNAVFITSLNTNEGRENAVILTLDTNYKADNGTPIAVLEKPKGLALIRRRAPNAEQYEAARQLSKHDICTPVS